MKAKRKVFYKFAASYSVILLSALFVNLLAFNSYQREVAVQSETYIRVFLSQIQFSFDEKIQSMHGIINNVRLNPALRSLMMSGGAVNRYTRYSSFELINALRSFTHEHNHVDSIIIVFADFEKFITNATVFRSFEEFSSLSAFMYWDEPAWHSLFEDVGFVKYTGPVESSGRYIYTVIRPVTLGAEKTPSAYLLINFHSEIFINHVAEVIDLEHGFMFVSDQNGNIIISLGYAHLLEYIYDVRYDDPSPIQVSILNRQYMQHHLFSRGQRLKYVFILPIEPFLSRGINQLILLLSGGMILFGSVMSFAMARYNASPITELTKFIEKRNVFPEDSTNYNELDYIRSAVDMTVHEYANIKEEFSRYTPLLQSVLISDVLKKGLTTNGPEIAELEAIGVSFPCEWYSVVLFEYHGDGSKTLVEYNIINIQLRNLIYDYFSDSGVVYICDLDAELVGCLLNLNYSLTDNKQEVRKGMKALIYHMQEAYGIKVTITAGGSTKDFSEIPDLYNKAADAVTHQLFTSPGQFAFFEDMRFNRDAFVFSNDSVQNYLKVNLKAGHAENVMDALNRAMDNISYDIPFEYVRYAYIDLTMLLHKTASGIGIDIFSIYEKEHGFNPFEAVSRSKNINIIKDLVQSFYRRAAEEIANRMADLKVPLEESIKAYIDDNYHNPNLSLSLVADHFDINPSYLSSFFKKSTGVNFVNYVNNLRLENASRLLEEESLQIGDIAAKVGYSNSSILITNFKKKYGITPGAFRNANNPLIYRNNR